MDQECQICRDTTNLIFGPDPFDSEILGDDTDVWLCETCYQLSADEVQ